jgi:ribosome-interacting GTPase 1
MPTNLPPEYFEVDKRYRAATSLLDRIALLEELIGTVPKHKGTDHLRADLRKKLSTLKGEAQTRKSVSRRESAFRIEREGAGQVAVVGPTNTGKSALVAALTNATPEVSDAPYTTWAPTPGMMRFEDVQIQLIDTPPLERGYLEAEFLDLIRRADLILLLVDLETHPDTQLEETISLLRENGICPQHPHENAGELEGPGVKPILVLANKTDDQGDEELYELFCQLCEQDWSCLPVSALTGRHLDRLRRAVFEALGVIRVYAKPPGEPPDLEAPFVLKSGSTVEDLARKVHRDFYEKLAWARLWGSAAFEGQMVQRDYVLQDKDVVELRI